MESLLLDTHALLWWLAEPDWHSPRAHAAIAEDTTRVFVSTASGWEIATKVRLGKLPAASELVNDLAQLLEAQGFELLPITLRHGLHAGGYAVPHRDPFDRLLGCRPSRADCSGERDARTS